MPLYTCASITLPLIHDIFSRHAFHYDTPLDATRPPIRFQMMLPVYSTFSYGLRMARHVAHAIDDAPCRLSLIFSLLRSAADAAIHYILFTFYAFHYFPAAAARLCFFFFFFFFFFFSCLIFHTRCRVASAMRARCFYYAERALCADIAGA